MLLTTFVVVGSAAPQVETFHARLEDFLRGWSFDERMGLQVATVRVGNRSVADLFQPIDFSRPSFMEYYLVKKYTVRLRLTAPSSVERLRTILVEQKTDRIRVVMQDERGTIWKKILPDSKFNKVIEIIVGTTCDEVTRVIYDRMNSLMRDSVRMEGQTEKHIYLDQLFDMLLRDNIEPYMRGLDPIKQADPCFGTFRLLKWLRGEDVPGFEFNEYHIHEGLQNLLEPILKGLVDGRSTWGRNALDVNIVGFTDSVPVKHPIRLSPENTGVANWGMIAHPLQIHHAGCAGDTLTRSAPVFLEFDGTAGAAVGSDLKDNCDLGAARAYVTTAYIMRILGNQGIRYRYATGGIHDAASQRAEVARDAKKRKVDIEFVIKRAIQQQYLRTPSER